MNRQKDIPISLLQELTTEGFKITTYGKLEDRDLSIKAAHRDDHYIFVFQIKGKSRIAVDFSEIELIGSAILCILPGQVHRGLFATGVEAVFIAVETALVKDSFRYVFEEKFPEQSTVTLKNDDAILLRQSLRLLMAVSSGAKESNLQMDISKSLLDACVGMIANSFNAEQGTTLNIGSRPVNIAKTFRRLVSQSYKAERKPSGYAREMNITASYLNEAVKQVTGFSASYWIRQQIIIEAKRVLFYTDYSVKQVSTFLGFEDHHYFSRFFTRGAGMSPMGFRQSSRK